MALLTPRPMADVPVAISECLLGVGVRFDGGHKRSALCHDRLSGLFDYRPVCPEVGIGLGVPREPIQLVANGSAAPRALHVRSRIDVTDALNNFARTWVESSAGQVCGYILMKGSPSCGMSRVRLYNDAGVVTGDSAGVAAAQVMASLPLLPCEESGRLQDAVLRENFVVRVLTYAHWRTLRTQLTAAGLLAFHSAYKLLLLAHSVKHYQESGRLLADLSGDVAALADEYFGILMRGLARPADRGGHTNVLSHLQGYLKQVLDSPSRQELAAHIEAYRRGEVPLIVPISLLRHLFRRFPNEYVEAQVYLNPHPARLGLRNEI